MAADVDIPTEERIDDDNGAWKNVRTFHTRAEAIEFVKVHFAGDDEGKAPLVSGGDDEKCQLCGEYVAEGDGQWVGTDGPYCHECFQVDERDVPIDYCPDCESGDISGAPLPSGLMRVTCNKCKHVWVEPHREIPNVPTPSRGDD